jgi:SAM-dependent methyltransferase
MPINTVYELNAVYWDQKYQNQETGWDIGTISEPLKCYIDQLEDKNIRILIPGCGNAYEAKYLIEKGFKNITVIDVSETLVLKLKHTFQNTEQINMIHGDFFEHIASYDLVIEQTFFCAIHPSFREQYVSKMYELLSKNGKLVGLLFDKNFESGPPFGGNQKDYQTLFSNNFNFKTFEKCYNSILPRKNSELFIILEKK